MRKILIFILSLPLLALAIIWIPIGLMLDIFALPIWGSLGLISMLRGKDGQWEIFLGPPLMGLSMYSETTGLISDPLENWI